MEPMMRSSLHRCTRGGTGLLEYLIVFALVGLVVGAGAHVYGDYTRGSFERGAVRVDAATAGAITPEATTAAGAEVSALPVIGDWRRWVDLLIALPFAIMLFGVYRRWRHRRASRRQADARERAEALRAMVGRSAPADGNLVPDQEIAQVVAIHRGGARGARDVAAVAAD